MRKTLRGEMTSMKIEHTGLTVVVACGLALLSACGGESPGREMESAPLGPVAKGGDDRTGEYDAVPGWWKPAPDHEEPWVWGQVSAVAVDNPDRVIVGIWGDRDGEGREREGSTNYVVAVDRDGNITENWSPVGLDLQQASSALHQPLRPRAPRVDCGARRRQERQHADPQVLERRERAGDAARRSGSPHHPGGGARQPAPGPVRVRRPRGDGVPAER